MRSILALLMVYSFSALAQSPRQTVEWLYQHYARDRPGLVFDAAGDEQIISTRFMQAMIKERQLTPEGDVGLDYDPVCNCQDFDNLVLEKTDIVPHDSRHVDAIVRFRPFGDSNNRVTQKLLLVNEKGRWLIDDIVNDAGSLYQEIVASHRRMGNLPPNAQKENQQ